MTRTTDASGTAIAFSQIKGVETAASNTAEGLYVVFARREEHAAWLSACLERIARLHELKENWNSYGAKSVEQNSIRHALELTRNLAEVTGITCPTVAASPAGYVALSWNWQGDSRALDLEILPDGTLRYSYLDEHRPQDDKADETIYPNLIAHLLTQW